MSCQRFQPGGSNSIASDPCQGEVQLRIPVPPPADNENPWITEYSCDHHYELALQEYEMAHGMHISQVPGYIADDPAAITPKHMQLPDGRIVPIPIGTKLMDLLKKKDEEDK